MSEQKKPRRVLIGTPTHDGRLDVLYVRSLTKTIKTARAGVALSSLYVVRESLLQVARNEIIAQAVEGGFDDLIFIDSDMAWDPAWIYSLLDREEQVVGGTARRKSEIEDYTFLIRDKRLAVPNEKGLVPVDGIGTGFLRIGREALLAVWDKSIGYVYSGKRARAVCEVGLLDGRMLSEDYMLCAKLAKAGYQIWLDPSMTCPHVGVKNYEGDVRGYLERISSQKTPAPDSSASE